MPDSVSTFILAPIRGITDVVYRRAVADCFSGFDRAIAPFIQLRRGRSLRPGERRRVDPANKGGLPTVPQVHTNNPESFKAGLHALHELGHAEVNWNLGCPWPRVAKRKHGAGLLPYPERIKEILENVLAASPVRLSVKLRLGRENPDEFLAVLDVLNGFPLTEVILHARTATQLYDGSVDLDRAVQFAGLCNHPFVYNGDIVDRTSFAAMQQRLPHVTRWMLGRGALKEPFLAQTLKGALPPNEVSRRERLRSFHDQLYAGYRDFLSGPGHLLNKMKEHWAYLVEVFADPEEILLQVTRKNDEASYQKAVDWAFQQELISLPEA